MYFKILRLFVLLSIISFLLTCSHGSGDKPYQVGSWEIMPDTSGHTLSISHRDLGKVLQNVQIAAADNSPLTGWTLLKEDGRLTIKTSVPLATAWSFTAVNEVLEISADQPGFLLGTAPADESRIPARTKDQDNGIMYTSLGLVSADNIICLFDRPTGTMIHFPSGTLLRRHPANHTLLRAEIPAGEKTAISLTPDYYTSRLGLKYYQPKRETFQNAPVAWSTWYTYYMGLTEGDVMREADALAKHLLPYGLELLQIDACYTRGEAANYIDWNKEAFPGGGKKLFEYIKNTGLKPALWINIYGSNYTKAEMAEKYPENFYLRDENGELSGACCTADKTVVRLDYSNPEVITKHLIPMFTLLKEDWGLRYLKDAGWGTWIDYFDKNRERAFDSSHDGRFYYLEAQKALRETLGPEIYIGGCAMHEVGLGFGIFDGSRTGGDDKAVWYPEKPRGMSMQTYFNSLFGANYLNNIVWHCDPDAAMVRNPLTLDEGRTVVSAMGLTGQLFMASDFMDRLPPAKMELYQKTMPTTPIVPMDLYPFRVKDNKRDDAVWCCPTCEEFPRALDLKINGPAGFFDVVALFNWEDNPQAVSLSLQDDLGLEPGDYAAFDFWNQSFKGIVSGTIAENIPTHGTTALVLKKTASFPQLLATSRHITNVVSLRTVEWQDENSVLRGQSTIVPGSPYSLFFHVPEGFEVSEVQANGEIMYHKLENGLLEVKFSGLLDEKGGRILNWAVMF